MFKKQNKKIKTFSFGDSKNDFPLFKSTDKSFLVKGPEELNKIVLKSLNKMEKEEIEKAEKIYAKSIEILKKFQLKSGAILASSPKGRYPYIYPRDHSICILALIELDYKEKAKRALKFILKSQNKDGSFPQRLTRKGEDASYKPIQLDNTGLVLYAFAKYIQKNKDEIFLKQQKSRIKNQ